MQQFLFKSLHNGCIGREFGNEEPGGKVCPWFRVPLLPGYRAFSEVVLYTALGLCIAKQINTGGFCSTRAVSQ